HADTGLEVADVRTVPGSGVEGRVQGRDWRLGQAAFAGGGQDDGAIWLGDGRSTVARFSLRETLRPDAAEAVRALRTLGLRLHLCSGDAATPVQAAAAALGIDGVHARQRPEDKLALVRRLQARGRIVAMVGDGLNDAP